jgi:hypothetical protein
VFSFGREFPTFASHPAKSGIQGSFTLLGDKLRFHYPIPEGMAAGAWWVQMLRFRYPILEGTAAEAWWVQMLRFRYPILEGTAAEAWWVQMLRFR